MNSKVFKFVFGAALAVAAFQAVPAMAVGIAPASVQAKFDTMQVAMLPPVGMLVFCQGHGSQCRADSVSSVSMTDDLLAALQTVNSRVNSTMRPRRDVGRDVWSVGSSSGDCEDFALTKRAALIRQGIPAGALRIATTTTRRGEPHAILVVKTTRGDYVLDNLRADVRSLGGSGYRIRTISTRDPRVWAAG